MPLMNYFIFDTQKHDQNQLSYYLIDEIASRLLEKLDFVNHSYQSILIDGFWSESAIQALIKRFSNSKIFYQVPKDFSLSSEFDEMTLIDTQAQSDIKFDLILSNLYLHHFQTIESPLTQFMHLLSQDGCLFFTTIGPVTLFPQTSKIQRPNNWVDMHDFGDSLRKLLFKDPVMDAEVLKISYQSQQQFSQDLDMLCDILAINRLDKEHKKVLYMELELKNQTTMPVEIIYGHAWQQPLKQVQSDNEVYISLDQLKLTKNKP
ncbi:MAG: hypothetical protein EP298_10490 [Gammaproteobacteria bacterium]|nr:MAG: hypothetical protein EP298_10490 [Gammaproteobacteria bacterium]UTW42200.1 hypothetical protein KFE69_12010 [bacterium SCSIO 12844]